MSIKKQLLKSKDECKVSFRLSQTIIPSAQSVNVVGQFNDWNTTANPMKKLKCGDFTLTLNLPKERSYQFKYFINGKEWIIDPDIHDTITDNMGGVNSIITTN